MQRVFDTSFLFLHLGLGRGADIDDGHSTGEFRQAFLQFFLVVVRGDRKSTRLNSSHSQISYAVFCLKKKKKNVREPAPVIFSLRHWFKSIIYWPTRPMCHALPH